MLMLEKIREADLVEQKLESKNAKKLPKMLKVTENVKNPPKCQSLPKMQKTTENAKNHRKMQKITENAQKSTKMPKSIE